MTLKLITGRAVTGKTGALHRAVISAAGAGQRAVLLVPSFGDVQRARSELAGRVAVGVEVDTLDRWAERLWALTGDGRRVVTDVTRGALVREILEDARDNPLASSRGYHDLVASLAARSAGMRLPDAARPSHVTLLEHLHAYRSACSSNDMVERGEMLYELGRATRVDGAVIAINRFTDLSPAQLAFILGMAERNDVWLAFNWDEASRATDATRTLVATLRATGCVHEHLVADAPMTELDHLERRLFDPGAPLTATGAVSFMTAAGDEAECALVARAVASEIAAGVPPQEIAVTFRDVARREFLLRAAFQAEAIDCEIDMAVALEATALGRSLGALLHAVGGDGGRAALLTFLLSPYASAEPSAVEEFDAWVRRNRAEKRSVLLARAEEIGERTEMVIQAARSVARSQLDVEGAQAWKRLMDAAVQNGLLRPERTEAELRIDGSVHSLVVGAAGELAALPSGQLHSAASLLDFVSGSQAHSGGQERSGAVYVTEAHRLRSRRFSRVILGGLTADEFSSEKREPLAVQVLSKLGLPAGTDERLSERLLFYSVVTRARHRLVLVRQSSNATGSELRASVFWDEIGDLYRTPEAARTGEGTVALADMLPLGDLQAAAPAFGGGRRALRRLVSEGTLQPAEATRGAIAGAPWDDPQREFSVTELETYHGCPYRWFYERVVRPKELDSAFDARERGALVHAVLAEFYRRHSLERAARVTPEDLPAALDLLDVVWEEVSPRFERTTRGLQEELAFRQSKEQARETITQDALLFSGFVPTAQEWRFGEQDGRPFAIGSVRLRGSVDRLDDNGGLVIVTDYKSSSGVIGQECWRGGGHFQIVAYGEAARHHLGRRIAGGFYRSLATGRLRGFWNEDLASAEDWVSKKDRLSEAEYLELVADVGKEIEAAAEGIRASDISPRPRDGKSCTWCGARPFCGEASR